MSLCRTLGGELEELYELRHTSLAVQKMQVVVKKTSAPCPLRSESDRSVALPRSVAMCQNRTPAPQQRTSLLDRLVGKRASGYVCPLPPATDIRSQEAKCVAPFRGTGGWGSFGVSRGHAMKLPADNFRNW